MSNSTKLIIWIILVSIFILIYYRRYNQIPNLSEAINLALASGGFVTSISLLQQLVASPTLTKILEKEVGFDITALYLGVVAVGWVSLQPITQLFQTNTYIGTISDCQVNSGKIIYLHLTCKNRRIYKVILEEEILEKVLNKTNHSLNTAIASTPNILVNKNISVVDVVPIAIGKTQELRVTQAEQIVIN